MNYHDNFLNALRLKYKAEIEVAKSLFRRLEAPGALDSVPFVGGKIKVLEINIGKNCPLVNTELSKLTVQFPNLRANILGVIRGEKFVILKKKDKLLDMPNKKLLNLEQ